MNPMRIYAKRETPHKIKLETEGVQVSNQLMLLFLKNSRNTFCLN